VETEPEESKSQRRARRRREHIASLQTAVDTLALAPTEQQALVPATAQLELQQTALAFAAQQQAMAMAMMQQVASTTPTTAEAALDWIRVQSCSNPTVWYYRSTLDPRVASMEMPSAELQRSARGSGTSSTQATEPVTAPAPPVEVHVHFNAERERSPKRGDRAWRNRSWNNGNWSETAAAERS